MKERTKEEIDRQISGLKAEKESLPEFTIFGDNNWERIDMQIDILEGKKSYSDFEHEEPEIETVAYQTEQWLDGEDDEDLFSEKEN